MLFFDPLDFKEQVLEMLGDEKYRVMYELRVTLFVNALEAAGTRPQCLMPFPSYFFDPQTNTKKIDELNERTSLLPPLDNIKGYTELPLLTWKLLHWIFTNPLNIIHRENNDLFIAEIIAKTKLNDFPIGIKSQVVHFEIFNPHPKDDFIREKNKHGTFFAYHGSSLENFHSIVHRGLISALNQHSSHGHGTYLTLQYDTAYGFARDSSIWKHSNLTAYTSSKLPMRTVKCIAIVEVVDDPRIEWSHVIKKKAKSTDEILLQRRKAYCCVVPFDHLLQLSYIMVLFKPDS